jgi:hypothetical protein
MQFLKEINFTREVFQLCRAAPPLTRNQVLHLNSISSTLRPTHHSLLAHVFCCFLCDEVQDCASARQKHQGHSVVQQHMCLHMRCGLATGCRINKLGTFLVHACEENNAQFSITGH